MTSQQPEGILVFFIKKRDNELKCAHIPHNTTKRATILANLVARLFSSSEPNCTKLRLVYELLVNKTIFQNYETGNI